MPSGIISQRPSVMGTTHMVAAGHYQATMAGYRVLEEGGNAIDAGVASGIALNVVMPEWTSFGGTAPIMVYQAETKELVTVSGLGRWPRAASIDFFMKNAGGDLRLGVLRCLVPAAADAWLIALEKFGTMPLQQVMSPAVELAERGFPVTPLLHDFLANRDVETIKRDPSTAHVVWPKGRPPEIGEVLVQSDLAHTFRSLIEVEQANAHKGREAAIRAARDHFYKGDIAQRMVRFNQEQGGLLTLEDLAEFTVDLEKPYSGRFKSYTIYACGPWRQGPVVPQTLQMLEEDDLASLGHNSADYMHLVVEALNLTFADRHQYYGDPDFVEVPMAGLLSKEYARSRRDSIDMSRAYGAMPPPGDPWPYQGVTDRQVSPLEVRPMRGGPENGGTSYVCVVDRWGNAFSATPTDDYKGSPIIPGLGFPITGRGAQSWLDPDHPAALAPWKRPRLTPNPSIVMKDGHLFMPLGSPGQDAQCQAMVQAFLNVVEFGMDPQTAIEQPRFVSRNFPASMWPHGYTPGTLALEARIPNEVAEALAARGHQVSYLEEWDFQAGGVCAIQVDQEGGLLRGGADPRREGYVLGR